MALFRRFCIAEHQIAFRQVRLVAGGCAAGTGLRMGRARCRHQAVTRRRRRRPSRPRCGCAAAAAASAPQWVQRAARQRTAARGRHRPGHQHGGSVFGGCRQPLPAQAPAAAAAGAARRTAAARQLDGRGVRSPARDAFKSISGPRSQALALAWTQPYAVECNSITGRAGPGFRCRAVPPKLCGRRAPRSYANSASARPYTDHGMRLSMLLAAHDVDAAKRLIDRGVAADRTLGSARRTAGPCLLPDHRRCSAQRARPAVPAGRPAAQGGRRGACATGCAAGATPAVRCWC